jgi:signal transduction histidine kinase
MGSLERSETRPAGHARRDLQRASDFQAALLGIAGHDLRQPLQVIQGAYELLGARVSGKSERAWLERGERAIARLTEQLDELVGALHLYEYAKSLEISPVALAPLFWRLCDENGDAALRKGIDLRVCPTRASVISNPLLLNGVLRNLVRNAIKYTKPGGRVLIGCRRSGADVRIDVCDTGIGIAPEHLPIIFQAFERLDTTRRDGLGIGLFVVRRAIELLGHRIDVSSCVARGSRFSVRAPRSR